MLKRPLFRVTSQRYSTVKQERGAALATVLGVFAVISILALALSITMVNTLTISNTGRHDLLAQNAAESGIAQTVAMVNGDSCPAAPENGLVIDSNPEPQYAVQVYARATSSQPWVQGCPTSDSTEVRLLASGKSGDLVKTVAAVYAFGGGSSGGSEDIPAGFDGSGLSVSASGFGLSSADGSPVTLSMATGDLSCAAGSQEFPGGLFLWDGNFTGDWGCQMEAPGDIRVGGDVFWRGNNPSDFIHFDGVLRVAGNLTSWLHIDTDSPVVVHGNATINQIAQVSNDLLVGGTVRLEGTVGVDGKIHAGGAITIPNSGSRKVIDGDLISNSYIQMNSVTTVNGDVIANGDVTISGGSTIINGNIYANGNVAISQNTTVTGNIIAKGGVFITAHGGSVNGNIINSGTYYATNPSVLKGSYTMTTNPPLPAHPTLTLPPVFPAGLTPPAWVDFGWNQQDWIDRGYTVVTLQPGVNCTNPYGNNAYGWGAGQSPNNHWANYLSTRTTKTVVNALACGQQWISNFNNNAATITLQTDVAVIGNSFELDRLTINGNNSTVRKLHFLTPDGEPNTAGRQCSNGGQASSIDQYVRINAPVEAFFYSPCALNASWGDHDWRGMVYTGSVNFGGSFDLAVSGIELPGTNLGNLGNGGSGGGTGGTGGTGGPGTPDTLNNRVSQLEYTGSDAPVIPGS